MGVFGEFLKLIEVVGKELEFVISDFFVVVFFLKWGLRDFWKVEEIIVFLLRVRFYIYI